MWMRDHDRFQAAFGFDLTNDSDLASPSNLLVGLAARYWKGGGEVGGTKNIQTPPSHHREARSNPKAHFPMVSPAEMRVDQWRTFKLSISHRLNKITKTEKKCGEGLTYLRFRPNRPNPAILRVLLPSILTSRSQLREIRPRLARRRHKLARILHTTSLRYKHSTASPFNNKVDWGFTSQILQFEGSLSYWAPQAQQMGRVRSVIFLLFHFIYFF